MARVVNLRHEEYDVLIARPSKWGNPFQIGRDGDREQVIEKYEIHLRRRPDLLAALPELAGEAAGLPLQARGVPRRRAGEAAPRTELGLIALDRYGGQGFGFPLSRLQGTLL